MTKKLEKSFPYNARVYATLGLLLREFTVLSCLVQEKPILWIPKGPRLPFKEKLTKRNYFMNILPKRSVSKSYRHGLRKLKAKYNLLFTK